MKREKIELVLSMSGIFAPIIGISLVVVLGALEPGYNHMSMMMSVLGGIQNIRGVIFNFGIILVGILIILFAINIHKTLNQGAGSRIGPVMLVIGSIGIFGAAFFACNQDCVNVTERSFEGIMHIFFAFIAGLSLALAPGPIYFRLKEDPQWVRFSRYTLITVILSNAIGILFWGFILTGTRDLVSEVEGLIQRFGILFTLIWIGVISTQILILNLKKS